MSVRIFPWIPIRQTTPTSVSFFSFLFINAANYLLVFEAHPFPATVKNKIHHPSYKDLKDLIRGKDEDDNDDKNKGNPYFIIWFDSLQCPIIFCFIIPMSSFLFSPWSFHTIHTHLPTTLSSSLNATPIHSFLHLLLLLYMSLLYYCIACLVIKTNDDCWLPIFVS